MPQSLAALASLLSSSNDLLDDLGLIHSRGHLPGGGCPATSMDQTLEHPSERYQPCSW